MEALINHLSLNTQHAKRLNNISCQVKIYERVSLSTGNKMQKSNNT